MADQLTLAAGDLPHRITIKSNSPTYDEYNRPQDNWTAIQPTGTFWAAIEPLQGRELERAKEVAPTATHLIRMRYAPGIGPKMQVYYGSEAYDINAVVDVLKRKIQLRLYVTALPGVS